MSDSVPISSSPTRRDFLASGAALGAAVLAAPLVSRAQAPAGAGGTQTLKLGLIGCGEQGRVLINAALKIPDIRFEAVCDIWDYNRTYGERLLKKFGHPARPFEDYREMLSAVPELDAVVVATPDWLHAEHTNASLRAGKHVYCEKLMSNTIEGARSMVKTAKETGKLLQIGHQRRSNPRYLHARDKIVREHKMLGRITNLNGEWNRSVSADLGWPERFSIPENKLNAYGYPNMPIFRNWRWYRKYAGGPISDLGAHQIDMFNWFLGANPVSVFASGGADYYEGHEWYDNVMAIYEYATAEGPVRAFYQVLTTTSAGGGYHEYFMGTDAALKMSENPKYTKLYREARAPEWEPFVEKGLIRKPVAGEEGAAPAAKPWEKEERPRFAMAAPRASVVDVRETAALSAWDIPVTLDKAIHQPHLENFVSAIRHGTPLACPAADAFASSVTVLRVNEAVAARKVLTFAPSDFIA
jgi:predicted dehydrogenase